MTLVSVLARVDTSRREEVWQELERQPGLTPFRIEDDLRMGILIEAASIDEAHTLLQDRVDRVDGVLGTWPVYMAPDSPEEPASHPSTHEDRQGE